jgi:hypothetical protein
MLLGCDMSYLAAVTLHPATVSTVARTSRADDYVKIMAIGILPWGLQLTVVRCFAFGYAAAVKNARVGASPLSSREARGFFVSAGAACVRKKREKEENVNENRNR